MRRLLLIGIGAGDPDHLTVQAIKALNQVDVVFVIDKGSEKDELARLRREICHRHITNRPYRFVAIPDPQRDRTTPAYTEAVQAWRTERALVWEQAIRDELDEDGCGAFLIWGDPSLYDSTIAVIDQILARGTLKLEYDVVPGITSIQALAARHRVALNRPGGSIQITTGRRLADGSATDSDDIVVMLDSACAFTTLAADGIDIYWGAYVGMDDEILIKGDLSETMDEIQRVRAQARDRHGWIMDTYLLKRRQP